MKFDEEGRRIGGARLVAVVTCTDGESGRQYRVPTGRDYAAIKNATDLLTPSMSEAAKVGISPVRPSPNARGLTAPVRYGAIEFADLFTARRRLAIATITGKILELCGQDGARGQGLAMILALGRCIDQTSAQVRWLAGIQAIASSFPRQALQMTWDFVESVPVGEQSANFGAAVEWVAKVAERHAGVYGSGQTQQGDARKCN